MPVSPAEKHHQIIFHFITNTQWVYNLKFGLSGMYKNPRIQQRNHLTIIFLTLALNWIKISSQFRISSFKTGKSWRITVNAECPRCFSCTEHAFFIQATFFEQKFTWTHCLHALFSHVTSHLPVATCRISFWGYYMLYILHIKKELQ